MQHTPEHSLGVSRVRMLWQRFRQKAERGRKKQKETSAWPWRRAAKGAALAGVQRGACERRWLGDGSRSQAPACAEGSEPSQEKSLGRKLPGWERARWQRWRGSRWEM